MDIHLSHPNRRLNGTVQLERSKSISNRLLILQALAEKPFHIEGLSDADDTQCLVTLLNATRQPLHTPNDLPTLDAGAGGTTFRFLLAYLALRTTQPVVLTGSARLQKRPIAGLVEALRTLGADITYTEQEGFAPVCITPVKKLGGAGEVRIDSSISSQFISALMMIAPYLHTRNGLTIHLEGNTVSSSYITLTIAMMQRLGVNVRLNGSDLHIPRGSYHTTETHIEVERDWSGASYWFALAAVADEAEIILEGLSLDSVQPDRAVADFLHPFLITETLPDGGGLRLRKRRFGDPEHTPLYHRTHTTYDFRECPDIAQTVAVAFAANTKRLLLTGLTTLRHKETDRIAALEVELYTALVWATATYDTLQLKHFFTTPDKDSHTRVYDFCTYDDHRMAMAFAPFALVSRTGIIVRDAEVVRKSYPRFWEEMQRIGFEVRVLPNKNSPVPTEPATETATTQPNEEITAEVVLV